MIHNLLNNTSSEYDLQSVYKGNSYLGVITELSQVFLAIYDTAVSPHTYTGSENIDITNNRISSNLSLNVNGELVLNPRAYDGAVFEMSFGTDNCIFFKIQFMGEHRSLNFIHLQNYAHFIVIVRFHICILKHL